MRAPLKRSAMTSTEACVPSWATAARERERFPDVGEGCRNPFRIGPAKLLMMRHKVTTDQEKFLLPATAKELGCGGWGAVILHVTGLSGEAEGECYRLTP